MFKCLPSGAQQETRPCPWPSKASPRDACGGQKARLELQASVPPADAWFGVSDPAPRLGYLHMYNELSGEQDPFVTSLVVEHQTEGLFWLHWRLRRWSHQRQMMAGSRAELHPSTPPPPMTLASAATPPAWGLSVQAQEPLLTFHAHTLIEKLSCVSRVPAHS